MPNASQNARRRRRGKLNPISADSSTDDIFAMNEFVHMEMEQQAEEYRADPLLIRQHIQELRDMHIDKSMKLDSMLAALHASATEKVAVMKQTFYDKWTKGPNSHDRQLAEMELNCHITQLHAMTNLTVMNMSQSVQKQQLDNALTTMTRFLESAFLFNDQTQKRLDAGKKEMDELVSRHKSAIESSRLRCNILEDRISAIELQQKVGGSILQNQACPDMPFTSRRHRSFTRKSKSSRDASPAPQPCVAARPRGASRNTSVSSCASARSVHDQITAAQDTAFARAASAGRYRTPMFLPPPSVMIASPMPQCVPAPIPVPLLPVYFSTPPYVSAAPMHMTEDAFDVRTDGSE